MLKRAWLSFLAMAAGWFLPSVLYVVGIAVTRSGFESALALAYWTGIFVFAAWLLIALPIALFVSPHSVVFRRGIAPLFGGAVGFLSMAWTITRGLDGLILAGYAMLIGILAGVAYSWLLGHKGSSAPAASMA